MNILITDNEIIQKINEYPNPNYIWIEIWEMSKYEIQVVVTVNEEESCHLGQHKVIHLCSAQIDDVDDVNKLKTYGKLIVRFIRQNFLCSEVHSRLYYKG